MRYWTLFICFLLIALQISAKVIYVKQSATGAGTSWSDAFGKITDALAAATPGDQVWVAQGTYYASYTGNKNESIALKNGVQLIGGFTGIETSIHQRADTAGRTTFISGNLGAGQYSIHIITADTSVKSGTTFSGFTVKDGKGNFYSSQYYDSTIGGIGFFNNGGNLTITNTIFRDMQMSISIGISRYFSTGGAAVLSCGGVIDFIHTKFINNKITSEDYGGAVWFYGGAALHMYNTSGSIRYCAFDSSICIPLV